ncbi:MAG TPA: hypothetical protein VJM34_08405 [Novosphingobium sp.]|nr:hypothetical protein [Novosphingobium sp.]
MLQVVSLELNEINFDFVQYYVADGRLPNFARALARFELSETVAEDLHPFLEPWIQWPTVYTGKDYAGHKVFRLGDIVETDHRQIWETLADEGISVGAISPINGANRVPGADFFVPDPWTVTPVTGDASLRELSAIVTEAVNGNAHGAGGMITLARRLTPFVWRYASVRSWREYSRILGYSVKYKWARAAFLDFFLSELFLKLRAQKGTQFASLFLNAGAHIQHHHMFEAGAYKGDQSNPSWYSSAKDDGVDPLLFIYEVYDAILGEFMDLPNTRLFVTTGLSQVANPRTIYQYRFTDHAASLTKLGVTGFDLAPRMSRDFLLSFPTREAADAAKARMEQVTCAGQPMFTIEDRELSLFCQIGYFGTSEAFAEVTVDGRKIDMRDEIVLVSIENGIHQTIGYHIDTAMPIGSAKGERPRIPLTSIFDRMRGAFAKEPARVAEFAA